MNANQHYCFTNSKGQDILLFRLTNDKGTEVCISNYGAIITSFKVQQADGKINDIVLGFDEMRDYFSDSYLANYPWFGAAVGRYANRISKASFTVNGKTYKLTSNSGANQLHGGIEGFDKKIWTVKEAGKNFLELSYTSKDGEEGYPGTLVVDLRYELNDEGELSYAFQAKCDKACPVNLTHHSYFNLDTDKTTIDDHILRITASHVLEQDENLLPTGKKIEVAGTSYDFTQPKQISQDWDTMTGYDQSFITGKEDKVISLVAEVWSQQSGLKLEVWSTEPVVHFYSGVWIPRVEGKNGVRYGPYSGFCLETQVHPNAVNIPEFPDTLLHPGNCYFQKTIYKVKQEPLH